MNHGDPQRWQRLSPVDGHTMDELTRRFSGSADMTTAAKEYRLFTHYHLRLLARHQESAGRIVTILEEAVQ